MTLLSVLLVLLVEFYFRWGAEYRHFNWFDSLQLKITDALDDKDFFEGWGGVALILAVPLLILSLFLSILPDYLYDLGLFISACVILFWCLGPKPLADSYASYFKAMERGDAEAGYLSLQEESLLDDSPDSDQLVRNVTRSILIESQKRYFGVIFWFIFLGPFGALFYRLSHHYHCYCLKQHSEEHAELLTKLVQFIDWAPSRLTSLLFLLGGDFVKGFYRVKDYLTDMEATSDFLLGETGIAALGLELQSSEGDFQENRDAFAMVNRTLIIYLVAVAALSPLAFW